MTASGGLTDIKEDMNSSGQSREDVWDRNRCMTNQTVNWVTLVYLENGRQEPISMNMPYYESGTPAHEASC